MSNKDGRDSPEPEKLRGAFSREADRPAEQSVDPEIRKGSKMIAEEAPTIHPSPSGDLEEVKRESDRQVFKERMRAERQAVRGRGHTRSAPALPKTRREGFNLQANKGRAADGFGRGAEHPMQDYGRNPETDEEAQDRAARTEAFKERLRAGRAAARSRQRDRDQGR